MSQISTLIKYNPADKMKTAGDTWSQKHEVDLFDHAASYDRVADNRITVFEGNIIPNDVDTPSLLSGNVIAARVDILQHVLLYTVSGKCKIAISCILCMHQQRPV